MTAIRSSRTTLLFLAAPMLACLQACTPHSTGATEVGIRFNKLTKSIELAEPAATYFFTPMLNDWKTYDVSTQNLVMSTSAGGGDRQEKDDLQFKTRDGNDIETDVTIRWRIDPSKVSFIWSNIAPTTDTLKERVVRPLARTYTRDILNRLDSEGFYNPDLRFAAASDATTLLANHLRPYGVIVEGVILGNFSFKADYQNLINAKKEAEKKAEKLESQILATQESNKAKLQEQIAVLTGQLTVSQGQFEQAKRAADAYVVRRNQEALATVAEKTAVAEGIRKERAALNSSAGDAYVSLQLIDALQKKEIRQIPKLPNGNVIIDGNKLLQQLGVIQYQQQKQPEQ